MGKRGHATLLVPARGAGRLSMITDAMPAPDLPFALSKIRPPRPRAGSMLARPALEARLAEALLRDRAVLLCAAAGYGKTALLAHVLATRVASAAVAWIALDDGDDLRRLLGCLMAALEPYDVPWRTSPEGLVDAAERPQGLAAAVAEIVNALDACDVPHGVIVLDDVHHLHDEAAQRAVEQLLAHLSPRWTVAMTARHEPAALRLARLRAQGELAEFGQAQLAFSAEETAALWRQSGLDAGAAEAIHRRTAGWPAGLRLALAGGGSGRHAIDRAAFDFLADEVLAGIDPALREFLLRASVLHELDAARCEAVTGDARSAQWLEQVERQSLFATVVGDAPLVIRLHDLFRDALRHRLRLERPDELPALRARAAAHETDPARAQALWLAAGRPDDAARALLAAAVEITTTLGGVLQLKQLCAQFPADYAEGSAELHRVLGFVHWVVWETRPAEHHLQRAEVLYAARGEPGSALLARAQRAIILVALGQLSDAGRLVDSIEADRTHTELPDDAVPVLALARTWHALEGCRFGDVASRFAELVQALEARPGLRAWSATIPPPRQTPCRGIDPWLARWADGALRVCGERPVPLRAAGVLTHGWRLLWQGRLDEAAEMLARAEADAKWTGEQVIGRSHGLAMRALLAAFRGERDEALAVIRTRLAEQPQSYGDWGLWHATFLAARVAGSCGDAALLHECLQRMQAMTPTLPDATRGRLQPLVGLDARLAALEGRAADAERLWREALADASSLDLLGQAAEVQVRLAHALAPRARAEAAQWLGPVLDTAQPGGALFARSLLPELAALPWGPELAPLQRATLQRWADAVAAGTAPVASPAPASVGEPPLTAREFDVLEQIASGASNKLIARTLQLSPHTVKRHVANILGKLELSGRGQATAWWLAHKPK